MSTTFIKLDYTIENFVCHWFATVSTKKGIYVYNGKTLLGVRLQASIFSLIDLLKKISDQPYGSHIIITTKSVFLFSTLTNPVDKPVLSTDIKVMINSLSKYDDVEIRMDNEIVTE